jgi:hypothetical protein
MLVSGKVTGSVVEGSTVNDMYLWYIFLNDVDYLVEKFYLYSIQ